MAGRLELICGPSGTGKTSFLEETCKSFRWTTRPIRRGEIDSSFFDGTQSTQGYFKEVAEFDKAVEERKLVGIHRYPNPESGYLYGFPKTEMIEELQSGSNIYEQIVSFEPIDNIVAAFNDDGYEVYRILALSSIAEISKRLRQRGGTDEEIGSRLENSRTELEKYLEHRGEFDRVYFAYPRVLRGNDAQRVIETTISTLKNGEFPDDMYDSLSDIMQWHISLTSDTQKKIDLALHHFRSMRGHSVDLILNHFIHDPKFNSDFKKLAFMQVNRSKYADREFLTPLGVAFIFRELGYGESFLNELIALDKGIYDVVHSGDFTEDSYRTRSISKLFQRQEKSGLALMNAESEGTTTDDDILDFANSSDTIYQAIKDLNFYILMEKEKFRSVINLETAVTEDYCKAAIFNAGLVTVFTGMYLPISGDDEARFNENYAMSESNMHTWVNLLEGTKKFSPQTAIVATENPYASMAELNILSFLSQQVDTYARILTAYTQAVLEYGSHENFPTFVTSITNPLIEYLNNAVRVVPPHPLVAMGIMNVQNYFSELEFIYESRQGEERNCCNCFFPTPTHPRIFLARHWDFNIYEPREALKNISDSRTRLNELLGFSDT